MAKARKKNRRFQRRHNAHKHTQKLANIKVNVISISLDLNRCMEAVGSHKNLTQKTQQQNIQIGKRQNRSVQKFITS